MFHVSLHIAHNVCFQWLHISAFLEQCLVLLKLVGILYMFHACVFNCFVCLVARLVLPHYLYAVCVFCIRLVFLCTVGLEYDDGHDYGDDSEEVVSEDDGHDGGGKSCFHEVPQHFSIATDVSVQSVESEASGGFVESRAKD